MQGVEIAIAWKLFSKNLTSLSHKQRNQHHTIRDLLCGTCDVSCLPADQTFRQQKHRHDRDDACRHRKANS